MYYNDYAIGAIRILYIQYIHTCVTHIMCHTHYVPHTYVCVTYKLQAEAGLPKKPSFFVRKCECECEVDSRYEMV